MTQEEFAQAVERYGDMVFRVAYSSLRSRPDAEDVMQDTLLKLYQSGKAFESEDHRKHWLIRVAINECRKAKRWYRRIVPLEERREEPVFDTPAQSELFDRVMALPGTYRLTVYLYYYEDYSVRQVADAMDTNPSTVQSRLMRARGLLKQSWKEAWSQDG